MLNWNDIELINSRDEDDVVYNIMATNVDELKPEVDEVNKLFNDFIDNYETDNGLRIDKDGFEWLWIGPGNFNIDIKQMHDVDSFTPEEFIRWIKETVEELSHEDEDVYDMFI